MSLKKLTVGTINVAHRLFAGGCRRRQWTRPNNAVGTGASKHASRTTRHHIDLPAVVNNYVRYT